MTKSLVVGASGTVGKELVKLLTEGGHHVARATSKREGLAPDQVHLDLVGGTGIKEAFAGVDRAFLLSPPGYTNQHQLLAPLIEQSKAASLSKVVLMTAMGANAFEASPMRQAELALEKSGLAYNIIRPNWFMQNFNSYWLQGIRSANKISLPVGQAKTSFIDARDIAATASALLQTDEFSNRDFDLTGPESLTHGQVAGLISEATGKAITFEDSTPEALLSQLDKAGLPRDYAEFLVMILGALKQGHAERRTDAVQAITGRAPIAFAQYARDYRAAWM